MNMIRLVTQNTNKDICCFLAEDDVQRANGLNEWGNPPRGGGLLFVMPVAQDVTFWMDDVSFPIDIVMLDENAVVKSVYTNCQPGSQDRYKGLGIKWVLELRVGECARMQIVPGVVLRATPEPYEFDARVRPELLAMHAAFNGTLEGGPAQGSCLSFGDNPVGWGWNKTHMTDNPTSHSAMMAIADTIQRGSSPEGAELYTTRMPCMMCGGAMTWCRIPKVHFLMKGHATTMRHIADQIMGPVPMFDFYT